MGRRRAHDLRDSCRCERADLCGAEQRAGLEQGIPHTDVTSGRTDVRSGSNWIRDFDPVVLLDNMLDRHDGVGSLGHGAPGRDLHRLAGRERAAGGQAGGDPEDDRQAAGEVAGADREAVHRRAREGRQIDTSGDVLRKHAARRGVNRDALRVERPRPGRARARGRRRWRATGASGTYANCRDLGDRPRARRGAQRRAPPRRAGGGARPARPVLGGRLRRRRLHRRDVRRPHPAARSTRRRSRREAAAELRQGRGAAGGLRSRSRARSSSRSTATSRTTRPRSRGCSPSSTRASTSSRAGRRSGATRSAAGFRHGSSTSSPAASRDCGCTISIAG